MQHLTALYLRPDGSISARFADHVSEEYVDIKEAAEALDTSPEALQAYLTVRS